MLIVMFGFIKVVRQSMVVTTLLHRRAILVSVQQLQLKCKTRRRHRRLEVVWC